MNGLIIAKNHLFSTVVQVLPAIIAVADGATYDKFPTPRPLSAPRNVSPPIKRPERPARPTKPPLPPPKRPSTPAPSTCKKERICGSKRVSEEFRILALALHKELRRELDVNTWYFSGPDTGMKELDLEYNCELENLAYRRIQSCRKAFYSSKTHNSAVIRKHLGQEKVMAFLRAFSYWRNGKEKRTGRDTRPQTEYDKLTWRSTSALGCAVKQCKKRGEKFTLVDCKYDYETMLNVPRIAPG